MSNPHPYTTIAANTINSLDDAGETGPNGRPLDAFGEELQPDAPNGWDSADDGTVPNGPGEPHETFWARVRNDRGMRDPQLAVETHDEQERHYTRSLRRLIGSTA